LLIGGIALVVVLLLVGGGIGAYFLWFSGVNRGSGDEDPLAYIPAGTEVLIGLDYATVMSDKDVKPLIDQLLMEPDVRTNMSVNQSLAQIDKRAKDTGLDPKERAAQIIVATTSDSFQGGGAQGGGMPGGGMPGGGMPGGMGGGGGPGGGGMPPGAPPTQSL